jgi:MFS family permease
MSPSGPGTRFGQRRARALAIVLAGCLVAPLDSAVNAAFPAITAAFSLELAAIRWIVISYLVAFTSCVIVAGRLGDLFGYRRVFGGGLLVSAAALLACGLAPSYAWLLAARVAQGVGIALVVGAGPALALSIFRESARTRILGRFGAAFAIGLAAGPALGGVLVDAFGWQAVFLARVPLALGAWLLLRGVPATRPAGARAARPRFRLALFRSAAFLLPNLAAVAVHFAGFLVFLLGPYFFVRALGLSAQQAGLLLALGPGGAAIGSALAGPAASRWGVRRVALAGMLLDFAGVAIASTWDGATRVAAIGLWLAFQGLGIGLFQVAYTDIVVASLPSVERGVASSLTNFTRTLGVVGCAALGSALFGAGEARALAGGASAAQAFLRGYAFAFGSVAAGAAAFLLLGLLRPRVWFSK